MENTIIFISVLSSNLLKFANYFEVKNALHFKFNTSGMQI